MGYSAGRPSAARPLMADLPLPPPPRPDGRPPDALRPLSFEPGFVAQADGSVLVRQGRTMVLVTASVDEGVPGWLRGKGRGWVTAEYGMLPGSTGDRKAREAVRGKQD